MIFSAFSIIYNKKRSKYYFKMNMNWIQFVRDWNNYSKRGFLLKIRLVGRKTNPRRILFLCKNCDNTVWCCLILLNAVAYVYLRLKFVNRSDLKVSILLLHIFPGGIFLDFFLCFFSLTNIFVKKIFSESFLCSLKWRKNYFFRKLK